MIGNEIFGVDIDVVKKGVDFGAFGAGASQPVTVTSVLASPSTGDLGISSGVAIGLVMSGAVTVSGGTPTLTLSDGGTATYDAADSSQNSLVFTYVVAAGQNVGALGVTAINLNGATIKDSSGNSANLSGALKTFSGLQIDTTAPTVTAATLTVNANSAATPIGISAPTDASSVTITVTGLPSDGAVLQSDGVTAVSNGQSSTTVQLAGLEFKPTAGLSGQSSAFTYSVKDAAGNTTPGSATLAIAAHVAPTVTAVQGVSIAEGHVIPATSLIASVNNPSGDRITQDIFMDHGGGSGYFTVNGVRQGDNTWIYPNSSDNVQYVGGSSPGADVLQVGI